MTVDHSKAKTSPSDLGRDLRVPPGASRQESYMANPNDPNRPNQQGSQPGQQPGRQSSGGQKENDQESRQAATRGRTDEQRRGTDDSDESETEAGREPSGAQDRSRQNPSQPGKGGQSGQGSQGRS